MVYRYAARWAAHGGGGVTAEDLHQEGFIAMLQAVDHFDPSLGTKFSTLLHVYLKKAFSVATGQQTTRSRLDPLQTAISLDAPLDDDLDLTLADVLPDPAAEARLLDIDERDRRDRLHADLEDALHTLTDEEQRTIRARYFQGLTLSEIAQTEGISKSAVSLLEQRAMRHLRHPSRTRALRKYQL